MEKIKEVRGLLNIVTWSIVLLIVALIIQSRELWSQDHVWAVHRWMAVSFGIVPCTFAVVGLLCLVRIKKSLDPRSSN
jgi:hypothetical protein